MKTKLLLLVIAAFLVAGSLRWYQTQRPARPPYGPVENPVETPPAGDREDRKVIETVKNIEALPTIAQIALTILSPKNGSSVSSDKVTIRGKTAARVEVFANEAETVADANGNFSVTVSLEEGENYILLVATDESGKVAEQELVVNYELNQ